MAIARREKDLGLEVRTLGQAAQVDGWHLRYQEGAERSLAAVDSSLRVGDPEAEVTAHMYAWISLVALGQAEAADVHPIAALVAAEGLRRRQVSIRAFFMNAAWSAFRGDWHAAREYNDHALAIEPSNASVLVQRAMLEWELGDSEQGTVLMNRLLEGFDTAVSTFETSGAYIARLIAYVGYLNDSTDHFDIAETAAESVLSGTLPPWAALTARYALALLAIARSDTNTAAEQYVALDPTGDGWLASSTPLGSYGGLGLHPQVMGSLEKAMAHDRLLGLLCETMGRLEQAQSHFELALVCCRESGFRPEEAWCCHDLANVILQRDNSEDRSRALSLLDESLAISSELGMRPLMERVLSRREILGA